MSSVTTRVKYRNTPHSLWKDCCMDKIRVNYYCLVQENYRDFWSNNSTAKSDRATKASMQRKGRQLDDLQSTVTKWLHYHSRSIKVWYQLLRKPALRDHLSRETSWSRHSPTLRIMPGYLVTNRLLWYLIGIHICSSFFQLSHKMKERLCVCAKFAREFDRVLPEMLVRLSVVEVKVIETRLRPGGNTDENKIIKSQ